MSQYNPTVRHLAPFLVLAALTVVPPISALAHEGEEHGMTCTDASINSVRADIQAMDDGATKTTAVKEVGLAEEMMAKKDMKACMTHLHNAMDAVEK